MLLSIVLSPSALSAFPTPSKEQLIEAGKIAQNIHHIHRRIPYSRALRYGLAILEASTRYGVETNLLISIAHQESAFRENLPEGKAGELGICQIRKMWVTNAKFREEFGNIKENDLLNPRKSFLFAAWILKNLRKSRQDGVIPYWSYYNATTFHHRYKYFKLVNRYLSAIEKREPVKPLYQIADLGKFGKKEATKNTHLPTEPRKRAVIGSPAEAPILSANDTGYWKPDLEKIQFIRTASNGSGSIPLALRKLQPPRVDTDRFPPAPSLVKAAFELNFPNFFVSLPVVD